MLLLYFFKASRSGSIELIETILILSAEMPDGLGLLLPVKPHGKSPVELLQRMFDATDQRLFCERMFTAAAQRGHLQLLEWLYTHFQLKEVYQYRCVVQEAIRAHQLGSVKWLLEREQLYVYVLFYKCVCSGNLLNFFCCFSLY